MIVHAPYLDKDVEVALCTGKSVQFSPGDRLAQKGEEINCLNCMHKQEGVPIPRKTFEELADAYGRYLFANEPGSGGRDRLESHIEALLEKADVMHIVHKFRRRPR